MAGPGNGNALLECCCSPACADAKPYPTRIVFD
jgi:hypothetical protein